jgi:hypothetical protein
MLRLASELAVAGANWLPVEALDASERVWAAARDAVLAPAAEDLPAVLAAVDALAKWRRAVADMAPNVRCCGFLATCISRLAVQDALAGRSVQIGSSAGLFRDELLACAPYEQLDRASALEALKTHAWPSSEFVCWTPIAFCLCVVQSDEDAILDERFLQECTSFDAACVHRHVLREALVDSPSSSARDEAADASALLAWARRSTRHANDELFELGREACAWCFLSPLDAALPGKPSQQLAAGPRAAEAHVACADGFNGLGRLEALDDAMVIHLFDYKARQLLGVDFLRHFFLTDLLPHEALAHLRRPEALTEPPPRVLRLGSEWLVVRGETVRGRFARVASALLSWIALVEAECCGRLFVSKRIQVLSDELWSGAVASEGSTEKWKLQSEIL